MITENGRKVEISSQSQLVMHKSTMVDCYNSTSNIYNNIVEMQASNDLCLGAQFEDDHSFKKAFEQILL